MNTLKIRLTQAGFSKLKSYMDMHLGWVEYYELEECGLRLFDCGDQIKIQYNNTEYTFKAYELDDVDMRFIVSYLYGLEENTQSFTVKIVGAYGQLLESRKFNTFASASNFLRTKEMDMIMSGTLFGGYKFYLTPDEVLMC